MDVISRFNQVCLFPSFTIDSFEFETIAIAHNRLKIDIIGLSWIIFIIYCIYILNIRCYWNIFSPVYDKYLSIFAYGTKNECCKFMLHLKQIISKTDVGAKIEFGLNAPPPNNNKPCQILPKRTLINAFVFMCKWYKSIKLICVLLCFILRYNHIQTSERRTIHIHP